jgi:hypothetical protein
MCCIDGVDYVVGCFDAVECFVCKLFTTEVVWYGSCLASQGRGRYPDSKPNLWLQSIVITGISGGCKTWSPKLDFGSPYLYKHKGDWKLRSFCRVTTIVAHRFFPSKIGDTTERVGSTLVWVRLGAKAFYILSYRTNTMYACSMVVRELVAKVWERNRTV